MHVLQYIKGSLDYKITYGGQGNSSLKPYGYVDADYGGDRDTRRSCSGHVLFMAGGPVAWGAKYQPTVVPFLRRKPSIWHLLEPHSKSFGCFPRCPRLVSRSRNQRTCMEITRARSLLHETQNTMLVSSTLTSVTTTYENALKMGTLSLIISPPPIILRISSPNLWAGLLSIAFVLFSDFVRSRVSSQGEY